VETPTGTINQSFAAQVSVLSELISTCLEEQLRREGLSLSAFELLSAAHSAGKLATQAEVSRRLGIAPASLSEAVKLAVGKNLVVQKEDDADRRIKILRLTDKGERILQSTIKALNNLENRMLNGVPDKSLGEVSEVLRVATRNLVQALA
jgi:MarR family transcriptional regulator for hemolysin